MSLDAAFGFQSQQGRALASIDSTKYPDTNKDIQQNLIRLNQFVDYIASYLQVMQKGIDKNTQDPIAQIQGMASDLTVLLGGGELLYGIDLGDLQYLLPAVGALLGFDGTTPFPINLFNAAEHFLLGYVVPLDSFNVVIEGIIDGWAVALGIDPAWIQAINDLLDAFGSIVMDLEAFLTALEDLLNILGPMSGFGSLWNAVTTLLGGFSLDQLGGIIDPAFKAVAPWIETLATAVNYLDSLLKAFTAGIVDIQGILNFSKLFTPFVDFMNGFFPSTKAGSPPEWDYITGWETLILNAILPHNLIAGLVSDASQSAGLTGFIPLENLAMDLIAGAVGGAQEVIDAIMNVFGYPPGSAQASDVDQVFTNLYAFLGNLDLSDALMNPVQAVTDFITAMLHPTNLLAPMNPANSQIFGVNIPVLDAGTKLSGVLGLAQVPSGIPQSKVDITAIAASIVTGILGGSQIPVLDAGTKLSGILALAQIPVVDSKITSVAASLINGLLSGTNIPVLDAGTKLSGILGLAQVPTGIPQSSINITSIAASIITGILGGSQIPVLDAGTKLSGVLGLAQVPTGIPQSSVNITSIAASIVTGLLSGTNIPVLDAGTKLSGVLGLAQVPTGIPQSSVNITSIAAGIITGILSGGQIPVLDAGTKLSGTVPVAQIPTGIPQGNINITSIAASIVTGILGGSQIPVLDAGTKLSGVLGLAQVPTGIPQSSINISNILASWVTGVLGGGQIPVLDAGTKLSGVLALAQTPTNIPQTSVVNLPTDISNRALKSVVDSKALAAANLVIDPGFDNPDVWAYELGSMSTAQSITSGTSRLLVSDGGLQSIALTASGGPGGGKPWMVRPGAQYYLEASVFPKATNVGGGNLGVLCSVWDSTGVNSFTYVFQPYYGAPPAKGAWTTYQGFFTIPAGYDGMIPYVLQNGTPAGDSFYWDRIVCKEATRVGNSPDLQTTQDMILNGLIGGAGYTGQGTGNIPTQARGGLDKIYADVLNHTGLLQQMASGNQAADVSGTTININFAQYPDGALPGVFSVTYSGAGTSTLGITGGVALWRNEVNDANRSCRASYNAAPTNTDYQIIRGTLGGVPEQGGTGGTPKVGVMGRLNSTSAPTTFVWGRGYCTGFLTYKGEMGCTVSNVETVWVSNISLSWSTDIRCVFGVGVQPRRYQFYSGSGLVYDYTESGTVSQMGAGFRNFGLTADICTDSSGNPKGPGTLASAAISDNAPPSVVGSGARMIRQNTASVAFAAGATTTDFPANYFDITQATSSDITPLPASNRHTVTKDGWYLVTLGVQTGGANSGGNLTLGIKKNGVVNQMGPGIRYANPGYATSFLIYLAANDNITPIYGNSDISAWQTAGQADGSRTYFAIALVNRSYA